MKKRMLEPMVNPNRPAPGKAYNIDPKYVCKQLSDRVEQIIRDILPGGESTGEDYVVRNPNRVDRSPGSFRIDLKTGKFNDFASHDCGGDIIELYAFVKGIERRQAAKELAERYLPDLQTKALTVGGLDAAKEKLKHTHFKGLGYPCQVWIYQPPQDEGVFGVLRFEKPNGKQIRPCIFSLTPFSYRLQAPKTRPLFNLDNKPTDYSKTVLIVEGEKTATNAIKLIPEMFVATSFGGASGVSKTDWTPLQGFSTVIIWPDNDSAGIKYARNVAKELDKLDIPDIRIVKLDQRFPDKWDLGDALPKSVTITTIKSIVTDSEPLTTKNKPGSKVIPYTVARNISDSHTKTGNRFRSLRDNMYVYNCNHYAPISKRQLQAMVLRKIQANASWTDKARLSFVRDTIANLSAMVGIPDSASIPFRCVEPFSHEKDLFFVKNGILDLREDTPALLPPTSDYFNIGVTRYDYDPAARPKLFLEFLKGILPLRPAQKTLQEFFGYLLTHDTSYQKALLMIGEGANGKSVICAIIDALLDGSNVSYVSIDDLHPGSFALPEIEGKLANICTDINHTNRVMEGYIKQLIAGERMVVSRKFMPPYTLHPTARLIFCANMMPRFTDSSDGISRRILPLRFDIQVPEAKRNPLLTRPAYWRDLGELPAILNWAIEGLQRLRQRSNFSEATYIGQGIQELKVDISPTIEFLRDHIISTEDPNDRLPLYQIITVYREWMEQNGFTPLNSRQLSREVQRVFGCKLSENPNFRWQSKSCRGWHGLRLQKSTVSETSEEDHTRSTFGRQ